MNGYFLDTSYIAAGAYFFCSLIYFNKNIELEVFFKVAFFALRLLCIAIMLCLLTVIMRFSQVWIYALVDKGLIFFGMRKYGGITLPYIYFITSPMLVFLLSYDSWRFFDKPSIKRFLILVFTMTALFLSGTRAHMIISILGVLFIAFWYKYHRYAILFLLATVAILLLISPVVQSNVVADMFSSQEHSNSTKMNYLPTYKELFSDPMTLFWGQGFNAHVWSNSFAALVDDGEESKTELTYLEYLRVFGIVGLLVLFFVIIILWGNFRKMPKRFQWIEPALLLYLIVSVSNPYIFSSNGMSLFGLAAAALSRESFVDSRNES